MRLDLLFTLVAPVLTLVERLTLLTSIVRSPLISVSRLELSTAEAGAFISGPRQSILREVYLVAKEEEKKRKENGELRPAPSGISKYRS